MAGGGKSLRNYRAQCFLIISCFFSRPCAGIPCLTNNEPLVHGENHAKCMIRMKNAFGGFS